MKVEFFHDVICSFCFPMSNRMHKIADKYNKLEINHRSFALGYTADVFEQQFGAHSKVKPEVLGHWEHANMNDDDHRFNIEGMRESDFLFPTSRPGLMAAKAAGLIGGEKAYWEAFDAIQEGLFVDNRDISDWDILEELISSKTSLDIDAWKTQLEKPETEEAVLADLQRVQEIGVRGAPTLVVEDKYLISGAQPQDVIEKALEDIAEQEGLQLNGLQMFGDPNTGGACTIDENGNWFCD